MKRPYVKEHFTSLKPFGRRQSFCGPGTGLKKYKKDPPSSTDGGHPRKSPMPSRLAKQYGYLLYLCFCKNILILVFIFIDGWLMIRNTEIAVVLSFIYAIHVSFHEFGHIFFLEKYRIPYQCQSTRWSVEITYCPSTFGQLEKRQKLFIILGGSLFSILLDVILILLPDRDVIATFAALLIIVETLNLIFGKDARVLEQTLKEKSQ